MSSTEPAISCGITARPLDVSELIASVEDPRCGAVASFLGTVRETAAVSENTDKAVVGLSYEVNAELAEARLSEICGQAAERWGLVAVTAFHRSGDCPLGEPTVAIACSAPHRREALEACAWLIDEIKATVPIFKKEIYEDGSAWVGAGG